MIYCSYELGGGPAVLMSPVRVNDGSHHVIIAERKGQDGLLTVDELTPIQGRSGGTMQQLNGNGNIYLGKKN